MIKDSKIAYAEIDIILNLLEDEYRERVPSKLRNFFKEEKMTEYEPKIDVNKPLEEQGLSEETMNLLAILYLNYWCDSEEEKQELINEFERNQKEIEEQYNPENIFKKRKEERENKIENTENFQMIEYKEQGFIRKLLSKIFKFFKK